jgi:hypothetical protein
VIFQKVKVNRKKRKKGLLSEQKVPLKVHKRSIKEYQGILEKDIYQVKELKSYNY